MADHGPGACGCRLEGRNAGQDFNGDALWFEIDQLIEECRHRIDAWIARADEGDLAAFFCQRDGVAYAHFLGAERKTMLCLSALKVTRQVEIEIIADPV